MDAQISSLKWLLVIVWATACGAVAVATPGSRGGVLLIVGFVAVSGAVAHLLSARWKRAQEQAALLPDRSRLDHLVIGDQIRPRGLTRWAWLRAARR